ncbi:proteasome regulatory particle lid subunit RPN3 [Kluyveromyces lactis]|uniref:KLLA0D10824p n=1 Tax=Kluyveromyces lactis (strain ATCC 8585 / CBS 2359 / DSM 70799 / NBRC 1267 / NRRL Y-1140 / WM37) TaxID=284590 RepID=Q6CR95_KLULA|nr:uncharacterized protein KLLA0_D10824g [Kluyveromyces lactis]CAH00640.1 KLLA0D10824p [Kluyveromyces lactis]|eukprot:XP_453544.1 uncharacterized protein KLLA0_D10824g [Kluyveromyces lactis]
MSSDAMDIDSVPEAAVDNNSNEDAVVDKLLEILKQVSKSTLSMDSRYVWKSLRDFAALRHDVTVENTSILVNLVYPDDSSYKKYLLKTIHPTSRPKVENAVKFREEYPASLYQLQQDGTSLDVSSEVNSFVHYIVQSLLLDSNRIDELQQFNKTHVIPQVLKQYNNRNLDLINAKIWFYINRANELTSTPNDSSLLAEMMQYLKSATLKHDNETKATLITSILRQYLRLGEIELAADFVSKVEFPSGDNVSSPLEARYYFYLSKIHAIQLDYSQSHEYVISALRKAPHTKNSLGFLQQANKLQCCIQLLMGDIPELTFFHQKGLEKSLLPYYHITKAVKLGDLNLFTQSLSKYKKELVQDSNYQLCVRLRSNVIKTGIRMISLTYKKISLKDICLKLHLDSEQTVEYMISRAIRDGVIEAKINHEEGYIETSELLNVYSTKQPQQVFDERIRFVNHLHSDYVTGMRFPDSREEDNSKKLSDESLETTMDLNSMNLSDFDSDLDDVI